MDTKPEESRGSRRRRDLPTFLQNPSPPVLGLMSLQNSFVPFFVDLLAYFFLNLEIHCKIECKPYNEMVDVFSYAIVLWELLTRKLAWEGLSDKEFEEMEMKKVYRPEIPSWCPVGYRRLIEACWETKPTLRPTFDQILSKLERLATANPVFPEERDKK